MNLKPAAEVTTAERIKDMQAIVKTNYEGKEKKECIESVTTVSEKNNIISIAFKDSNGHNSIQYIGLDGYTEIILR